MSVDFERIRELIAAIAATDLTEVEIESADLKLSVRRKPLVAAPSETILTTVAAPAPAAATAPPAAVVPAAVPMPPAATPAAAPAPLKDEKLVEVPSPMVGTFYRAPAPGEDPFIEVGDRVRSGQTVCIIEAMKLMNEIEAEAEGEIVEICVENAEPVEFGQVLMRVRPR